MGADRTITAAVAEIRYGYHLAGSLRGCTLTRTDGAWAIAGSLVDRHPVYLAAPVLTVIVRHSHGAWSWPVLDAQHAAGAYTARLGPPEH